MNDRNAEVLKYLAKAEKKLLSAKLSAENSFFDDAVSRAYYCIFHSISAVLLLDGREFSSHNQTLGAFNKNYIHSNIFPKEFGKLIYQIFEFREIGDYDIDAVISAEKTNELLMSAEEMFHIIDDYIRKRISEES